MSTITDRVRQFLWNRQHNYKLTFKTQPGQAVLADLARFCRATVSTYEPDARLHALAEGRREVWLRIANHLQLTPDELYALVAGEDA